MDPIPLTSSLNNTIMCMNLNTKYVMVKGVNAQKNCVLELTKIISNTSYEFAVQTSTSNIT